MRTIKFRGKRQSDEKWAYGSLVYSGNIKPAIYFEVGKGEVKMLDWCYVDPNTAGQFTGLHDKHGKEIYEGDIVIVQGWTPETCNIKYSTKIVYDEKLAAFVFAHKGIIANSILDIELEVIGNIHDNPELLSK